MGHDAVAFQLGDVELVAEGGGLEAAVDEVEQRHELGPGGGDHVGRLAALGHLVGQSPDLVEPAPAAVALAGRHPRPPGQLPGEEADQEQEDRHLDVVGVVDQQRQVGLRVEEVVGGGGGEGRDHPGGATAVGAGGHDDKAEDEGDVGAGDVDAVADVGSRIPLHIFVLRPDRRGRNGIDAPLTRHSRFLTRPWHGRHQRAPPGRAGWFCST